MVTQDVQLFRATVRENLTLSTPGSRTPASSAAGTTWAWGVAPGAAGGWTPCWAGGAGLSAGEAQLLAFTRAFLRDPGLVVLDEASSRLDPATERLIERAVGAAARPHGDHHRPPPGDGAAGGRDHDPGGGRIAEHGPRQALAADPVLPLQPLLRSGMEQVAGMTAPPPSAPPSRTPRPWWFQWRLLVRFRPRPLWALNVLFITTVFLLEARRPSWPGEFFDTRPALNPGAVRERRRGDGGAGCGGSWPCWR